MIVFVHFAHSSSFFAMKEHDIVLQKQSRMAPLNSTTPPIPIMDSISQLHSRMARHKSNIQFYKNIILDNYARSQQSGQISHLHNKALQNMIQRHKVALQILHSQISSLTTSPTTTSSPHPPTLRPSAAYPFK